MKDNIIYTGKKPIAVEEGIYLYSKDRYWGKATPEKMKEALGFINSKGWTAFKNKFKGEFDFTFDENRADWRFNMPIDKNSVVLETGAGMGRTTIPMARVAKKVVAFDGSLLRMRYLKKRAEKEGLDNIEVFVGDLYDLPLRDNSFDVITMNGVLEWVGKTDRFKNPRQAQIEALKICKRLLKKNGYLYIGIENRFALAYLRGTDHGGLKYTSYMPRFVANIYSKAKGRGAYQTYTYSKGGYENLIKEAGFENMEFYLSYPGYNLPRIIIPYDNLNILKYVIKKLKPTTSFTSLLVKGVASLRFILWLYRKMFFSFSIIVKK